MERKAGWFYAKPHGYHKLEPFCWMRQAWWLGSRACGDEAFEEIGLRIPEPAELAALIALRDGIEPFSLEVMAAPIRGVNGNWANMLEKIAALRRAASPAGEEK